MKSKDFLRSKGILSNDSHHFIIDFHDGREINLGDLLEEYAQQSQPSGMRCEEYTKRLEHIINTKEKERVKWADMCIKKQKRIEELESGYDKTSFAFFAQVEPKEVLLKKYYDANTKGWSEDMHNEWGNLVREDFNEWYKGYLYAIESSPAGAAEGASEGMAEALRLKWINLTEDMGRLLSGQRGVSIDKLNKAMNLVQEFVNTLPASLSSPGSGWVKVEDRLPENAGWVNDTVMFWSKKHGHALIGCYDFEFDDWTQQPWTEGAEKLKSSDVTHWRPLPAPPGVEDNQTKKQ